MFCLLDTLGYKHKNRLCGTQLLHQPQWRTAVAQWLRCCFTIRKVAGSIPAGVSGIFIDIKSHYCPGVDSASNRNEYQEYFLVGKGDRCVRLTTLPPSRAVFTKSGNLNFLKPSGPVQICNGTVKKYIFAAVGVIIEWLDIMHGVTMKIDYVVLFRCNNGCTKATQCTLTCAVLFGNDLSISQMKHQLDATLCRFYFCTVTLHVSGASAHYQGYFKLVRRPLVHVLSLQVSHHISLLGPFRP